MQAIEHSGMKREIELYGSLSMDEHLNDHAVKEVRVFRLQKGMRVRVEGALYKVIAARPNGKVVLKQMGGGR